MTWGKYASVFGSDKQPGRWPPTVARHLAGHCAKRGRRSSFNSMGCGDQRKPHRSRRPRMTGKMPVPPNPAPGGMLFPKCGTAPQASPGKHASHIAANVTKSTDNLLVRFMIFLRFLISGFCSADQMVSYPYGVSRDGIRNVTSLFGTMLCIP